MEIKVCGEINQGYLVAVWQNNLIFVNEDEIRYTELNSLKGVKNDIEEFKE